MPSGSGAGPADARPLLVFILLNGELAHRLKKQDCNHPIVISAKLRDEPQIRDTILSLLNSLSATDDLIMHTQGKGADIRNMSATLSHRSQNILPTRSEVWKRIRPRQRRR